MGFSVKMTLTAASASQPAAAKPKQKLAFYEDFALAGVAAVISKTAAAPIERVKLLVQNQDEMIKAGRLAEPYKGVIDCVKKTYASEGVIPFWRGNLANCIRYFPTQAPNFAFKDQIKALFKPNKKDPYLVNFSKNIASGGCAGSISLAFVYSLDYCQTRLANDSKSVGKGGERQFNGMVDVYRKTIASDGIAGLYRGFYFGMYDTLKPILLGDSANLLLSFCLGYGVTVTSGLISYPIHTIRRRMMMTSGQAVKYNGSID